MKKHTFSFSVHKLTRKRFMHTVWWSVFTAVIIVASAAAIGRAAHNFDAALIEKPDIAIYLLLPDEEIGRSTLLRGDDLQRDYLAETKDGPKMIRLKKGEKQWYVSEVEVLHE